MTPGYRYGAPMPFVLPAPDFVIDYPLAEPSAAAPMPSIGSEDDDGLAAVESALAYLGCSVPPPTARSLAEAIRRFDEADVGPRHVVTDAHFREHVRALVREALK